MSKRNVAYIKPQEPEFLRRLKEQVGYKEGPTVDTKREQLPQLTNEDVEDRAEDAPVVVVVNPGDLTEEEAEKYKKAKEEEVENLPARLDERIIFKPRAKRPNTDSDKPSKKVKSKSAASSTKLLSFDSDEKEEDS